MFRLLFIVFLAAVKPAACIAQSVRGVLVGLDDRPVAGAVVLLLNADSRVVARGLSGERGDFRITSPAPGSYRIRTLRIGFRPTVSGILTLVAGGEVEIRLALAGLALSLDTVRTLGAGNSCRTVARDSSATMFALWEQVRTALTAAQLSRGLRTIAATTIAYERTLDLGKRRIRDQNIDVRTDFVAQPWLSLSADSLRRIGYVVAGAEGGTTYHAPGLDVLLSERFLEDHCLRLASDSDASRIGIDFEPTKSRRHLAEIAGTLWLDRKTSELRSMTFRYANVSRDQRDHAGGEMEFVHMRNGMWAISTWNIQMPAYTVGLTGPTLTREESRLTGIRVIGGELALVKSTGRDGDTVWSRPPLRFQGNVLDSLSNAPIGAAVVAVTGTTLSAGTDEAGRFVISGILPGRYLLEVRTPSLDSIGAASQSTVLLTDTSARIVIRVPTAAQIAARICSDPDPTHGVVLGWLTRRGDSPPLSNVRVIASWTHNGEADARTNAAGAFYLCGLPLRTDLRIRASSPLATSDTAVLRIDENKGFGSAHLTLDQQALGRAVLTGVVRADSTDMPIPEVEISLPDAGLATRTNIRGEFRLADIAPGTHRLIVRRVGYGAMDTHIELGASEVLDRIVILSRVTMLDSMVITGAGRDPEIESFEEHRKMGLGRFVTREELSKREGALLSSFLQQMPGLRLFSSAGQEWVTSARSPRSVCAGFTPTDVDRIKPCLERERVYYLPEESEKSQGMPVLCHARVYLDRQLLNPGEPAPPVNIRQFSPTQVEAVEFYSGLTQLPQKYMSSKAGCGTLVIHTRRPSK